MSDWVVAREDLLMLVKLMKPLQKDGLLEFRSNEIYCGVVDTANVAVMEVTVGCAGDTETTFKVDFEALGTALNASKVTDVAINKLANQLEIVEGNHTLKLTEISMLTRSQVKIPQLKYTTMFTLEMDHVMEMLTGLAKSLAISVEMVLHGGSLAIHARGTMLEDSVVVPVECQDDARVHISTDYLEDYMKTWKGKVSQMVWSMRTDSPLIMEADYGKVKTRFMVAPRILGD